MNKQDNNYECDDQMVSHPNHYQSSKGFEVIDVIEAFTEDLKGIEATDTGNIIKYACRWNEKNGIQDIKKIIWYATHLLNHLEKEQTKIDIMCGNEKIATLKEKETINGK